MTPLSLLHFLGQFSDSLISRGDNRISDRRRWEVDRRVVTLSLPYLAGGLYAWIEVFILGSIRNLGTVICLIMLLLEW
jgi:hypothetical protein